MTHRSVVIPKGTVNAEKTTVVRIPVTPPENTSPLIVTNRRENVSQPFRPNDTQTSNGSQPFQYPQENSLNAYDEGVCSCPVLDADQSGYQTQVEDMQNYSYFPQGQRYCTDAPPENTSPVIDEGACSCPVLDADQNGYQSQAQDMQDYSYFPQGQRYCTDANGSGLDRIPEENSAFYQEYNAPSQLQEENYAELNCYCSENAPCQSTDQDENYTELNCYCSENAPCQSNDEEENYVELNCYCSENAPCQSNNEEYAEVECYCSDAAPCRNTEQEEVSSGLQCSCNQTTTNGMGNQCMCCNAAACRNVNDATFYSLYADSNNQDEALNVDYRPCPSSIRNEQTYDDQMYNQYPSNVPYQTNEQGYTSYESATSQPITYIPCPSSTDQQQYANDSVYADSQYQQQSFQETQLNQEPSCIPCSTRNFQDQQQYINNVPPAQQTWTYQDPNFQPQESQPNRKCKITHVSYRNYSQTNEEPVVGKTFVFDDPQGKGVSQAAFEELARSTIQRPPSNIPFCSDNMDFFNRN